MKSLWVFVYTYTFTTIIYNNFLFFQEKIRMDLDFIQIQHRENVLKLMQICGLDMKEAYDLYTECGYNFQTAVNRKFNPVQVPPPQPYQPNIPENNYAPMPFIPNAYDEEDIQYNQYKQFRRNGKPFENKYPVRSSQSFFQSLIPKFFKGEDDDTLKRNLQRFIDKRINLRLAEGNLSQAFQWCYKEKFPLAVIVLDLVPAIQQNIKTIFCDDLLVDRVINQQFYPYGINARNYDLQTQLRPFFNLQRDANTIVICRVTFMDQIQVISRIKLTDGLEEVKRKLKQGKSKCIQSEMDQSHLIRQYQEQRRGNFNYQRPKTIQESIKQREDRKIRKQQQEQFLRSCQPKTQPRKEQIRQNNRQYQQPQYQHKRQIKHEPIPVAKQYTQSIEQVTKIRQEKLSRLRKYTSGINFKIRLPSGHNLMAQVDPQQYVQYLFDFISLQPQDLGFNNQIERKFDIGVGFGGGQTLKGKERQKLRQLFEGSQALIVREIDM